MHSYNNKYSCIQLNYYILSLEICYNFKYLLFEQPFPTAPLRSPTLHWAHLLSSGLPSSPLGYPPLHWTLPSAPLHSPPVHWTTLHKSAVPYAHLHSHNAPMWYRLRSDVVSTPLLCGLHSTPLGYTPLHCAHLLSAALNSAPLRSPPQRRAPPPLHCTHLHYAGLPSSPVVAAPLR